MSVGFCVVSSFPQFEVIYKSKVGEDCVNWFIKELLEFEKQAMSFYYHEKRLEWNDSLEYEFPTATHSHICMKELGPDLSDRVRDHDHVTGKFRGAAHKTCNLWMRRTCKIPVFFHNFSGYDSHFIAMTLKDTPVEDIDVIVQGIEKYRTLSLGKYITFKASYQFLG